MRCSAKQKKSIKGDNMTICVPVAHIYRYPDLKSEHVDEALFGDTVEIKESAAGFCRITTDYGYSGYIEESSVSQENAAPNMSIAHSFADLLYEGKNYYCPYMTLPKGSRVDASFSKHNDRYGFVALNDKRIFYIHKSALAPIPEMPKDEETARRAIADTALSYLGTQYRWGGRTHSGIDCSGLAFMAYRLNGAAIWRDAVMEKSIKIKETTLEKAKMADLLYFEGHIAIYLENGLFVHSSASAGGVCYGSFDKDSEYFNEYLSDKLLHVGTYF